MRTPAEVRTLMPKASLAAEIEERITIAATEGEVRVILARILIDKYDSDELARTVAAMREAEYTVESKPTTGEVVVGWAEKGRTP